MLENLIAVLFDKTSDFVLHLSYFELIIITALESTFFPIIVPVETFIVPMGYLIRTGEKSVIMLLLFCTIGIILGCLMNYYMSLFLGRNFLYKNAKYFMINVKTLEKWEKRFLANSNFIMFIGRCVPVPAVKHLITIPAGLTKMNIVNFIFFNAIGGFLYTSVLLTIGYFCGEDTMLAKKVVSFLAIGAAIAIFIKLSHVGIKTVHRHIKRKK